MPCDGFWVSFEDEKLGKGKGRGAQEAKRVSTSKKSEARQSIMWSALRVASLPPPNAPLKAAHCDENAVQ